MAHGFEVYRADGTLQLSSETGLGTLRLIAVEEFAFATAETRIVPEFDDTIGVLQICIYAEEDHVSESPDVYDAPSVIWNNSTKELAYTPPSTNYSRQECDVIVTMYHYG